MCGWNLVLQRVTAGFSAGRDVIPGMFNLKRCSQSGTKEDSPWWPEWASGLVTRDPRATQLLLGIRVEKNVHGEVALKMKLRALTQDGALDPATIPAPADAACIISKPGDALQSPVQYHFML